MEMDQCIFFIRFMFKTICFATFCFSQTDIFVFFAALCYIYTSVRWLARYSVLFNLVCLVINGHVFLFKLTATGCLILNIVFACLKYTFDASLRLLIALVALVKFSK